jgi:hypothetical protein
MPSCVTASTTVGIHPSIGSVQIWDPGKSYTRDHPHHRQQAITDLLRRTPTLFIMLCSQALSVQSLKPQVIKVGDCIGFRPKANLSLSECRVAEVKHPLLIIEHFDLAS